MEFDKYLQTHEENSNDLTSLTSEEYLLHQAMLQARTISSATSPGTASIDSAVPLW